MSLIGSIALHRVSGLKEQFDRACYNDVPLLEKCEKEQIQTVADLFRFDPLEVMEKLDLTYSQLETLYSLVSIHSIGQPKSAFDMLHSNEKGNTFCLDQAFPMTKMNRGINEIVGPAGVGKTQWCLTASCNSFLPISEGGLGGGTIWFDTEGAFSSSRLIEIAQRRHPKHYHERHHCRTLLENTNVVELKGMANAHIELLKRLRTIEEDIIERNYKLIVVDGITAPVRMHLDSHDRVDIISQIATQLKLLSETCKVTVLVTNQVTSKMNAPNKPKNQLTTEHLQGDYGTNNSSSESGLVAALGVGWAHAVNTRFILETIQQPTMRAQTKFPTNSGVSSSGSIQMEQKRVLRIAKSPMFQAQAFEYEIGETGARIVKPLDSFPSNSSASSISSHTPSTSSSSSMSVLDMRMNQPSRMVMGTKI